METQVTEEELRALAYRLWETAGCPDGRADEFWQQARLQLCPDRGPSKADSMNDSDDFVDAPEAGSSARPANDNPGQSQT